MHAGFYTIAWSDVLALTVWQDEVHAGIGIAPVCQAVLRSGIRYVCAFHTLYDSLTSTNIVNSRRINDVTYRAIEASLRRGAVRTYIRSRVESISNALMWW